MPGYTPEEIRLHFGYTAEEIREHREAWLRDLESGEYSQGKGALVVTGEDDSKSYCCMGVGCETAIKGGLELLRTGEVINLDGGPQRTITYYNGMDAVFPVEVRRWLGFLDSNPTVDGHALSEWNDGFYTNPGGISFLEIAAKLRREWNIPQEETPE